MSEFILSSYAKINLSLRVLRKREDGYHDVRTTLQTVSLHDDISFESRADEQIVLTCDDGSIPTDNSNLIIRAARTLQNRSARRSGATIHLTKRIPAQAGLGGASSNAAVALLALAFLWKLDLSRDELVEIGAALGADVPFFLFGGKATGEGIGTEISPLVDDDVRHLIIITPQARVSTSRAYSALDSAALTSQKADSILAVSHKSSDSGDSSQSELQNDFERVIFDMEPEIERARQALLAAGAGNVLLAGSGSSVFGIFADETEIERASREIEREPGWSVFACATISRSEYSSSLALVGHRSF